MTTWKRTSLIISAKRLTLIRSKTQKSLNSRSHTCLWTNASARAMTTKVCQVSSCYSTRLPQVQKGINSILMKTNTTCLVQLSSNYSPRSTSSCARPIAIWVSGTLPTSTLLSRKRTMPATTLRSAKFSSVRTVWISRGQPMTKVSTQPRFRSKRPTSPILSWFNGSYLAPWWSYWLGTPASWRRWSSTESSSRTTSSKRSRFWHPTMSSRSNPSSKRSSWTSSMIATLSITKMVRSRLLAPTSRKFRCKPWLLGLRKRKSISLALLVPWPPESQREPSRPSLRRTPTAKRTIEHSLLTSNLVWFTI